MHKISQSLSWTFLYVTTAPQLTPRCRGHLEKLIVHLVKKFPIFYGTRRLISVHKIPSLPPIHSQSIQSTPSHPCLFFTLPSTPRSSKCSVALPHVYPPKPLGTSPLPCATWTAHLTRVFRWCKRPPLLFLNLRISLPLPEIACSISIVLQLFTTSASNYIHN